MYYPYLNLSPAEMLALEELPERDKDRLTPIFRVRPWLSALTLSKAFERIEKSFGQRSAFLLAPEPSQKTVREVDAEIDALLEPGDGFRQWCDLFEGGNLGERHIPSLQLSDAGQFDLQAERLVALGRGVMVPLTRAAMAFVPAIASRAAAHTNGGEGLTFLIDLGRQTYTLLLQEAELFGICTTILEACPHANLSVTCSTFPDNFGSITRQDIYERQLFQSLRVKLGDRLIYSDRGSARAEAPGGGGVPYPRIDYPQNSEWLFYRTAAPAPYKGGYKALAKKLMGVVETWDPALRIWGTQMVEKTADGDAGGISSPNRSTAVRINFHLHRQLWYDDPSQLYQTDDDWSDD